MSSRSTSPTPPSSSSNYKGESETAAALSNDALYSPLSSYFGRRPSTSGQNAAASATPNNNNNNNKGAHQHSLALQTSSSLRESSLVSFLASASQSIKTSHPHEYPVYRGMCGSISRFGTGDGDRAPSSSAASKSVIEGKLSNRSLVLVGGGIYSQHAASKIAVGGGGLEGSKDVMMGVVGLGIAQAAAASGRRERKRTGGNGIFGCISNKKRKRILRRVMMERKSENDDKNELKLHDGDDAEDASMSRKQPKNKELAIAPRDMQEKVGTVIETMRNMWFDYMIQLLSSIDKVKVRADSRSTLTLDERTRISRLLATAEHAGMPATIAECPSRRHLVLRRCVVVNETAETWKVATIAIGKRERGGAHAKDDDCGGPADKCPAAGSRGVGEDAAGGSVSPASPPSRLWKIIMIPKRGTVLEVDLPWDGASFCQKRMEKACVTVRLET